MYWMVTVIIAFVAIATGWYGFELGKETAAPLPVATPPATDTAPSTPETAPLLPDLTGLSGTLDLHGQGLTRVPDSVFKETSTVVLNLSDNSLSGSLPAEVRHLSQLRILDLSNNAFTGVPAEVGQLARLEVLDLSDNPITGLPYEIGNLRNLRTLDLRGTNYAAQDLEVIMRTLPQQVEVLTD